MMSMSELEEYLDESWFHYNYGQVDFRPSLLYNIDPRF